MKDTLRKYDDVLTADERFRLALAAMAREDDTEVERLFATCPRHTYTMADHDFTALVNKSWDAAATFGMAWLHSHKQYVEALWLLGFHQRGVEEGIATMTLPEVIHLLMRRRIELKATYVGLVRFCAAARLDWRELLHGWPPLIEEIESVRAPVLDDEGIAVPEEMVETVYQILANALPLHLDPGRTAGDEQ